MFLTSLYTVSLILSAVSLSLISALCSLPLCTQFPWYSLPYPFPLFQPCVPYLFVHSYLDTLCQIPFPYFSLVFLTSLYTVSLILSAVSLSLISALCSLPLCILFPWYSLPYPFHLFQPCVPYLFVHGFLDTLCWIPFPNFSLVFLTSLYTVSLILSAESLSLISALCSLPLCTRFPWYSLPNPFPLFQPCVPYLFVYCLLNTLCGLPFPYFSLVFLTSLYTVTLILSAKSLSFISALCSLPLCTRFPWYSLPNPFPSFQPCVSYLFVYCLLNTLCQIPFPNFSLVFLTSLYTVSLILSAESLSLISALCSFCHRVLASSRASDIW